MKTIAEKYNWKNTPSDITVETTRKLAAEHGKDGIITISWTDNKDGTASYQTTTAGKNKQYALHAAGFRDRLMELVFGSENSSFLTENRIEEHTD